MSDYQSLFKARKKWVPQYLSPRPLEYEDGDVPATIQRILALAIHLEIPVGLFVSEATKRELNITHDAHRLLLSNIGDEYVHNVAFHRATTAYPVPQSMLDEAALIAGYWINSPAHPLEKAALLECGVFLMSLAVLNLCGGQSLFNLALDISRDEQRHITTNRSILRDIGLDPQVPPFSLSKLRYETLDWMLGEFNVPEIGINKEWFVEQSALIVNTGRSRELSELTGGANYVPPFEVSNRSIY